MTVARVPMEVRFWRHVSPEPTSGCWLWTSSLDRAGYGMAWIGPEHGVKRRKASRVSWTIHRGPIPPGLLVCHKCNERERRRRLHKAKRALPRGRT